MKCPNCKTQELQADGVENLRCSVCGLFHLEEDGQFRPVVDPVRPDDSPGDAAGPIDGESDDAGDGGPGVDPVADASIRDDGTSGASPTTSQVAEVPSTGSEAGGVNIEIEGLGNRGCRRE